MNLTDDSYIRNIVFSHTPNVSYDAEQIMRELNTHIYPWANGHNYELKPAGSVAKGTNITGASDIDFFISLNPSVSTCNTLQHVYETLRNRFNGSGYTVREQNVSIGITHSNYKIDIVAGVQQSLNDLDHSIWKRKKQSWTKTNIDGHISHIKSSGRILEIKAIKIWRKLWNLDFPSFYLELSVIEALKNFYVLRSPSQNFIDIMSYFANDFVNKIIYDPFNQTNEVSEELTQQEKKSIKDMAQTTLALITTSGSFNLAIW